MVSCSTKCRPKNKKEWATRLGSTREIVMNVDPAIVHAVLKTEDIEGLLKLGAPGDEYSSEARHISDAVNHLATAPIEEELVGIFREVWVRSFGPFSEEQLDRRSSAFRHASREILSRVT